MIWFALYAFAVLSGTSGLLGHTPIVARAARCVAAWRPNPPSRGSRTVPRAPEATQRRPRPSWAHEQSTTYEEAA